VSTLPATRATSDPLALDPEAMRALGHQVVDELVEMLCDPATPALRRATPAEMERRLPGELPEHGERFDALMGELRENVLPFISRMDHPSYFAFIPGCGTWPGVLGDLLASGLNIYAGTWMESAGPTRLELVVLDWFKSWIGYPAAAAGLLTSGGSGANMTALACAREALLGAMTDRAVVYAGDQSHSSIARAARVLGFRPDQVRVLPSDRHLRMRPDALAAAIDADARAGREPLFVAASAGATNSGTVDPLRDVAAICRDRGIWLHVDGAYGAFAALSERGRAAVDGIELADSVTLDPHKWLYQPLECGALLVRDGRHLENAFALAGEYLKETAPAAGEVNFCDRGLQQSRSARALKVWLSLRYFGLGAFREAIDRCLDLAAMAEDRVVARPELELISPASLGIVCFRRRGEAGDGEEAIGRRNAALARAFEETGGLVSCTKLHGRFAIRLCVLNHTSRAVDVERAIDWFAETPLPDPDSPTEGQSPRQSVARPAAPATAPAEIARIPLFSGMDADLVARVAGWAREQRVAAGDDVTRAWDAARDFYVILDGSVAVERDGAVVSRLGPGGFFGEIAALDWGAGYGYARSATVTALEPLRVLALAPAYLARLMAEAPDVAEAIERAARERFVEA
jgi:glutamate/tyrosine decarboxylase-like PLP-dependent enzyme